MKVKGNMTEETLDCEMVKRSLLESAVYGRKDGRKDGREGGREGHGGREGASQTVGELFTPHN